VVENARVAVELASLNTSMVVERGLAAGTVCPWRSGAPGLALDSATRRSWPSSIVSGQNPAIRGKCVVHGSEAPATGANKCSHLPQDRKSMAVSC
jgi:hypothetical protein